MRQFADHGLEPCLNIDGDARDFLVGTRPSTHPDHLAYNAGRTQFVDLREATERLEVLAMIICGSDRRLLTPVQEATGFTGSSRRVSLRSAMPRTTWSY